MGAKQILYAPVRGTVNDLMAHTVGGVVKPAQVIMELEAFVINQDIGYVRAGQSAEIKINTL